MRDSQRPSAVRVHYDESVNEANYYTDVIRNHIRRVTGIDIGLFTSQFFQFRVGECLAGIELKHDHRWREKRRLFIETQERIDPDYDDYRPSGIYRQDNAGYYLIGDPHKAWCFHKSDLRWLFEGGDYNEIENGKRSAMGYLLPFRDMQPYILFRVHPSAEDRGDDYRKRPFEKPVRGTLSDEVVHKMRGYT